MQENKKFIYTEDGRTYALLIEQGCTLIINDNDKYVLLDKRKDKSTLPPKATYTSKISI